MIWVMKGQVGYTAVPVSDNWYNKKVNSRKRGVYYYDRLTVKAYYLVKVNTVLRFYLYSILICSIIYLRRFL